MLELADNDTKSCYSCINTFKKLSRDLENITKLRICNYMSSVGVPERKCKQQKDFQIDEKQKSKNSRSSMNSSTRNKTIPNCSDWSKPMISLKITLYTKKQTQGS